MKETRGAGVGKDNNLNIKIAHAQRGHTKLSGGRKEEEEDFSARAYIDAVLSVLDAGVCLCAEVDHVTVLLDLMLSDRRLRHPRRQLRTVTPRYIRWESSQALLLNSAAPGLFSSRVVGLAYGVVRAVQGGGPSQVGTFNVLPGAAASDALLYYYWAYLFIAYHTAYLP
eukprot:754968-Hanusia_phi.AAC.2